MRPLSKTFALTMQMHPYNRPCQGKNDNGWCARGRRVSG
jgi:hypothetical protein